MFLSHVSPGDVANSVVIVALCTPRRLLIIGRSEVSSKIYSFIHVRVLNQYFLSFIVQTTRVGPFACRSFYTQISRIPIFILYVLSIVHIWVNARLRDDSMNLQISTACCRK